MARRVFISVLGTGFYKKCKYCKDTFVSSETRFIQQALIEYHNVKSWTDNDRVFILLTDRAKTENWDIADNQKCNKITGGHEDYAGLKHIIEDMSLPAKTEEVRIDDGKNEGETWNIFNTVYNILEEGDELYVDLTHSFRYLPMLILVLSNYAKFMKKVNVAAISYGNYEALDHAENKAPIVDLLPLSILQDWTFAAANFLSNGDVNGLKYLCEKKTSHVLKLAHSQNPDEQNKIDESLKNNAKALKKFTGGLQQFVDSMKFCRGLDVYCPATLANMTDMPETTFIQPLNPLLDKIKLSMTEFTTEKTAKNCIMAAKWCFDKGQYQAAVTMLKEGITTFFCERYGIPINDSHKREIANKAIIKANMRRKNKEHEYINSNDNDFEKLVDIIASDGYIIDDTFLSKYKALEEMRNDFNHAGMRNNPVVPNKLRKNIDECITAMINILNIPKPKAQETAEQERPRLFINLSNHPSAKWSREQLDAAKAYGECMDMPFPNIDPLEDENKISEIADKYVTEILEKAKDSEVTVHVMGEMNLTFNIVRKLQSHGITCVASTSYRITEEMSDGSKKIEFHFKRFRKYE